MIDFDNVDDDYSSPGKKPAAPRSPSPVPTPKAPAQRSSTSIEDGVDFDFGAPVKPSVAAAPQVPPPPPAPAVDAAPSTPVIEPIPVSPVEPFSALTTPDAPVHHEDVPTSRLVLPNVPDASASDGHPNVSPDVTTPVVESITVSPAPMDAEPTVASPSLTDGRPFTDQVNDLLDQWNAWLHLSTDADDYVPVTQALTHGWKILSHALPDHDHQDMAFVMREAMLWEHLAVRDWATLNNLVKEPVVAGPAIGFSPAITERIESLDYGRAIRVLTMVSLCHPDLLNSDTVEVVPADNAQAVPEAPTPTVTPPIGEDHAAEPLPTADVEPSSVVDRTGDAPLAKPKPAATVGNGLDLRWVAAGALGVAVLIAGGGWWFARSKAPAPVATATPVVASSPSAASLPAAPVPASSPTVASSAATPTPPSVTPAVTAPPATASAPTVPAVNTPTVVPSLPPSPVVQPAAATAPASAPVNEPAVVTPAPTPVVHEVRPTPVRPHVPTVNPRAREKAQMDAINADLDRKLKALQNQ